jgi:hypothetical protein
MAKVQIELIGVIKWLNCVYIEHADGKKSE